MDKFCKKFISEDWEHKNTEERAKDIFLTCLVIVGVFGPIVFIAIAYFQ